MTGELYKDSTYVSASGGKYKLNHLDETDCDGNKHTVPVFDGNGIIYRYNSIVTTDINSGDGGNYHNISTFTKDVDYITEDEYPTFEQRVSEFGSSYYLKHDIENYDIIHSYVCFVYNGSENCMLEGDLINILVQILRYCLIDLL